MMQLQVDAICILDGLDFELEDMAKKEDPDRNPLLSVFTPPNEADEAELRKVAADYANDRPIRDNLRGSQRWRFAMRMRLASVLLNPMAKRYIDKDGAVAKRLGKVTCRRVMEWLLTDGIVFAREIYLELLTHGERMVSAPVRQPWITPDQIRKWDSFAKPASAPAVKPKPAPKPEALQPAADPQTTPSSDPAAIPVSVASESPAC
ncbi:MAG: hypothetical protein PHX41_12750 [Kiritimatiellae bacterium]|nr:hypothetical protein [Kiritimatiellia bacterium]